MSSIASKDGKQSVLDYGKMKQILIRTRVMDKGGKVNRN